MNESLRALIDNGRVHLMDGAIGTLLYDRGVFVNVCYDELNLSRPEMVEEIHRDYVAAGAEILETNTFGANPVKLSGFGLEGKTEEINRVAAGLAKRAAAGGAFVVGALGPLGIRIEPWGPTSEDEAREYFERQVAGLVEGGVDGFLLETFSDLNELRQALAAARSAGPDLPVFAQVTVEEGGSTSYGTDAETVARTMDEWGADVVGVNCSVGPVETLDAIERMARVTDRPLCAQPNAGIPRLVGDRKMYLASPSYMARYALRMIDAGARFVGGCCGTTPDHIREIRREMDAREEAGVTPSTRVDGPGRIAVGVPLPESLEGRAAVPLEERSALGRALARDEMTASVELLPPHGWDPARLIEDAQRAVDAGVDALTLVDASRGPRRMATIPAAMVLARETDAEVMVHYTCRDRNMLRMISDLLGAAAGGLRNLLVVSGDPPVTGPYPDHTTFSDIDSIGLTNVLHRLNLGMDPGGQLLEPPTRFVVGVALNQGAADLERERRRFGWKIDAGADFAVSQPVFDPEALIGFLDEDFGRTVPVMAGLWPLSTLRDAEYLDQEVPGVRVPEGVLERMEAAEARGAAAAREEGLRIMEEVMNRILPRVQGVHVTAPRGAVEPALEIIGEAKRRAKEVRRAG